MPSSGDIEQGRVSTSSKLTMAAEGAKGVSWIWGAISKFEV
jgi:hypothetical protein